MSVITRAQWGFQGPLGPPMTAQLGWWIHHSVTNPTSSPEADMRFIEQIGQQRFGRLSYSYAAHHTGVILEGQADRIGAHTAGFNSTTKAMVFVGNWHRTTPPGVMVEAAAQHIAASPNPTILGGHRDVGDTTCPGDRLYALIPLIRDRVRTIVGDDVAHPPESLNDWRAQHSIPDIPDWAGWDEYVRDSGTFAGSARWPAGRADLAWFFNSFVRPLQLEVTRQAQEIRALQSAIGDGGDHTHDARYVRRGGTYRIG